MLHALSVQQRATLSALFASALLGACGGGGSSEGAARLPPPPPPIAVTPVPPAPTSTCSDAGKAAAVGNVHHVACLLTTQGEIVVELYTLESQSSVDNFLQYAADGFYNNTPFDKVSTANGLVRGGGFDSKGVFKEPTHSYIKPTLPSILHNTAYTVSMVLTTTVPDAANSQFIFNAKDNTATLDAKYAVFGKVIAGTDVVDKLMAVATTGTTEVPTKTEAIYWVQKLQ